MLKLTATRSAQPVPDELGLGRTIYRDLDRDLDITQCEPGFWIYLTPCCQAAASADDFGTYCKSCYDYVPPLCGTGPDIVQVAHGHEGV